MIGRVDEVVVDCQNPAALAEFWSSVLGGEPVHRSEAWSFIDPPGWTRLAFQRVPESKQGKNRLHIDVHVEDVPAASVAAEALGAVRIGEIHMDSVGTFQVLQDPEGNEWCVVRSAGASQTSP
ncbi:VOC family protein [Arthrobacter oryzae]|jgi:catechol 2,3-dioxygenase-like lactoylglutathione lyase family enzyme|uniref:VOC family protein n=1 Tax=Arthrobacter oryzae TaxID=409290 RepID=UPI00278481B5|nr:VOC family protein [Arthrobacter oryzae]MDQ0077900.1 catechol 2,3-dioxygenase-like lactoylglutathione lyase family enzyme [Arthrobacter oryzae]